MNSHRLFTHSQRDLKFHFNLMLWNDSYPNTLTSCRNCFTPLSSLAVPRKYRKKNSCIIHTISTFLESYRSRPTVGGSMILWDRVSLLKNRRHDNLRKLSPAFDNRVRYRHAWYIPREIVAHRIPLKFNRTNHIPQGGPGKNNTSAGKCIRIPTCAATASKRFEEETCHRCQMIEL